VVTLLAVNGLHRKDLENTFGGRDKSPSNLEKELLAGRKRDRLLLRIARRERKRNDEKIYKKNRKKLHGIRK
jgi:hypothetical protein